MASKIWRYDGTTMTDPTRPGWREIVLDGSLPTTGGTLTGSVLLPDGSSSAPAAAFSADTDTGIYRAGTNNMVLVTGATPRFSLDTSGIATVNDYLRIADGTAATPSLAFTSDSDTGIIRSAADTVQIITGATPSGTFSSSALTSNLTIPGTFTHGGATHVPHHVGTTAPANPDIGWTWLDISGGKARLKTYNNYGPAYFTLTGSEYFTTPDSTTLDVTGDIELIMRIRMTDWSPSSTTTLMGKWGTSNNDSYRLVLLTTGKLRIVNSTTGSDTVNTSQTAASPFSDNTTYWIRVSLDVVNSSNRVANFYYCADQELEPTANEWTLIETVTTAGTTSIYSGISPLGVGADGTGGNKIAGGRIYQAIVRSGLQTSGTVPPDNTLAAYFTAGDIPQSFTTTWTSINTTGETWTAVASPTLTRHSLWRIIGGNMPSWDLHHSAQVTVGNASAKVVVWDTEDYDTDGLHAANADGITLPAKDGNGNGIGGWYVVETLWDPNNATVMPTFQTWCDVNTVDASIPTSDTGRRYANEFGGGTTSGPAGGSGLVPLKSGDVLRFKLWQAAGAGNQTLGFTSRRDLNAFRGRLVTHIPGW